MWAFQESSYEMKQLCTFSLEVNGVFLLTSKDSNASPWDYRQAPWKWESLLTPGGHYSELVFSDIQCRLTPFHFSQSAPTSNIGAERNFKNICPTLTYPGPQSWFKGGSQIWIQAGDNVYYSYISLY